MPHVGIIVGSLARNSINKKVAQALVGLAPVNARITMLDFSALPLYSYDFDTDYPQVATDWKSSIQEVAGIDRPEWLDGRWKGGIRPANKSRYDSVADDGIAGHAPLADL